MKYVYKCNDRYLSISNSISLTSSRTCCDMARGRVTAFISAVGGTMDG